MLEFMRELRKVVTVGFVGGSDFVKITEQLGKRVLDDYDYVFSENGLVAHKDGNLIDTQSLKTFLGDEKLKAHNIRHTMVSILREKFAHLDLSFSIGGQISFDVFPRGWDKTYCLRYLEEFQEIHFFGDKTYKGGNDHEIYESERTVGHTVSSPEDTLEKCTVLFLNKAI